jgi:hypothetical protein
VLYRSRSARRRRTLAPSVLMLIDTRDRREDPEEEPERRRPTLDLAKLKRFTPFGQATALFIAVDWLPPLPGYVAIVGGCWLVCRGLDTVFRSHDQGMRDYRQ